MIQSITVSHDHKTATITYTDGSVRSLYQSDGHIEIFMEQFLTSVSSVESHIPRQVYTIDDTISIAA